MSTPMSRDSIRSTSMAMHLTRTHPTTSQHRRGYEALPKRFRAPACWLPAGARVVTVLGYASILVVPVTLSIWLPLGVKELFHIEIFEGKPLGGSLTLTQAKAVDFISSAILTPFILCLFNYVWFANARASLIDSTLPNEQRPRIHGIPLHALVEASGTSTGSYNMFKIWALCRSTSVRLILIAILTVFAALAQSSLANIVAYEAYFQPTSSDNVQVRLLKGPQAHGTSVVETTYGFSNYSQYTSYQQRRQFGQQVDALKLQLKWQNMTDLFNADTGSYIAPNVTKQALAKLDNSVTRLYNVPALQATINCTPHSARSIQWLSIDTLAFLGFDSRRNETTNKPLSEWQSLVNGQFTSLYRQSGVRIGVDYTLVLPFLGIDAFDGKSIYAGVIVSNFSGLKNVSRWIDDLSRPFASPFGTIQAGAINLTESQNQQYTPCETAMANGCMIVTFGLVCQIEQRSGLVDLVRDDTVEQWVSTAPRWDAETKLVSVGSLKGLPPPLDAADNVVSSAVTCGTVSNGIVKENCNSTGFQTPVGFSPENYDFRSIAHNTLYFIMELQRISYETGALNTSSATPDLFVSVASAREVQRYRITYIPVLLMAGLLSLFFAAVATICLMIFSARSKSLSGRRFAKVDSLRLLLDAVAGLPSEDFRYNVAKWSDEELESWAKQYMVRYETSPHAADSSRLSDVVLVPFTKPAGDDRLILGNHDDACLQYNSFEGKSIFEPSTVELCLEGEQPTFVR